MSGSSDLAGRSALVVGGAGFVGRNLCARLIADGAAEVTVVDNLLSADAQAWLMVPPVQFIEGSIADENVLARLDDRFDLVFHLATYHGNQSSIHDPLADHDNNLVTTLRLLHHLRSFQRLHKFVYASAGCTVAEKGDIEEAVATEEAEHVSLFLDSPYQISKMVGELYCNYFWMRNGVPTVRARFQNVYGPGETLGAGKWRGTPATVWRNVIPTFIYRAIVGLPITLENGGRASRDFIFVDDIVDGLLSAAHAGEPGSTYNLATGVETTIRALAETILRLTNSSSTVEVTDPRPWDRSILRLGATEKAAADLDFRAQVPLDEGLERTIEWTHANLDTIEANIARHRADLRAFEP